MPRDSFPTILPLGAGAQIRPTPGPSEEARILTPPGLRAIVPGGRYACW